MRVLQSIASGVLGMEAFKGGWASALLGGALHFVIALGAALTFYIASRWLPILTQRPIVCGVLFGIAIYGFMERIVVPLSAAPAFKSSAVAIITGIAVHAFCIGLPTALFVRRTAD